MARLPPSGWLSYLALRDAVTVRVRGGPPPGWAGRARCAHARATRRLPDRLPCAWRRGRHPGDGGAGGGGGRGGAAPRVGGLEDALAQGGLAGQGVSPLVPAANSALPGACTAWTRQLSASSQCLAHCDRGALRKHLHKTGRNKEMHAHTHTHTRTHTHTGADTRRTQMLTRRAVPPPSYVVPQNQGGCGSCWVRLYRGRPTARGLGGPCRGLCLLHDY